MTHEKTSDKPKGIFPLLIDKMIKECCGNCSKGHGTSHVRYETPKKSLNEVKNTISSKQVVHLSFPIAAKETDEEYKVSWLVGWYIGSYNIVIHRI